MNSDYTVNELLEIDMNSKRLIEDIILPESQGVSETYGPFFSVDDFRKFEEHIFSKEYTKNIIFNDNKRKRHYVLPNDGMLTFNSKTRTIVSKGVPMEIILRMGLVK